MTTMEKVSLLSNSLEKANEQEDLQTTIENLAFLIVEFTENEEIPALADMERDSEETSWSTDTDSSYDSDNPYNNSWGYVYYERSRT